MAKPLMCPGCEVPLREKKYKETVAYYCPKCNYRVEVPVGYYEEGETKAEPDTITVELRL